MFLFLKKGKKKEKQTLNIQQSVLIRPHAAFLQEQAHRSILTGTTWALTHFSFFHAWSSQQHFLQGHRSLPWSLGEVSCPHPQGNCLVFHLRTDMEHCPSIFIPDIYNVFWKVLLVVRVKALWKWERKECFELRKVEY